MSPHTNPCPYQGIRVLIVSLLTACANLGALALGKRTHVYMVKVGLSENAHAASALLDLYAKLEALGRRRRCLMRWGETSVVSWNCLVILVIGFAVNRFGNETFELFKYLKIERLVLTEISFIGGFKCMLSLWDGG